MGRDREWMFDLALTTLAAPFILLVGLVRLIGRVLAAAVRNRQKDLDRVKGETEMMNALAEREKAAAELRECEGRNQPERAEPEAVLDEPSLDDSDSFSDDQRAENKAKAEAAYARVKEDEERRLADESLSEVERREWQNAYAQKRRELGAEIRKWI